MTQLLKLPYQSHSSTGYTGKIAGMRFPGIINTETVILNPTKISILPDYDNSKRTLREMNTPISIEKFQMTFTRPPWISESKESASPPKFPHFMVYVDGNIPKVVNVETTPRETLLVPDYYIGYSTIYRCPLANTLYRILHVPFTPNPESPGDCWLSYPSHKKEKVFH
ncbi:unnamed protein product [Ambrosiozyma monospora]|uniref:Unnamed protein product n=1 Tax=Ambrosiozyma monospora TaxID=43982 RepID=A0ACB5TWK9_AMBMO|nr:unnamed protein product [Ambrosiozyma monospora]